MKTNWIALRKPTLVTLMIASLMLLTNYACTDLLSEPEVDLPEEFQRGQISTESFTVFPEGESIHIMNGVVTLEFPEGAVNVPTTFKLSTNAIEPNDGWGYNLMNRTLSLEPLLLRDSRAFKVSVKIRMNYDVSNFLGPLKSPEDHLTIYHVHDMYAYSIGECCVDCDCNTVEGCINQCGIFVVGEN